LAVTKFGIFGLAHHHAISFARAIDEMTCARVAGIFDENIKRAKKISKLLAVPAFEDLEHLANTVDAGIVTTENTRKKDTAIALASRGINVLCDKPLGVTAKEAEQIINACDSRGVTLGTGYVARYDDTIAMVKKRIEDGLLGEISFLQIENRVDIGKVAELSPWLYRKKYSGGGAITEHSVHAIDIANYLIDSHAESVYAVASSNLDRTFEGEDNFQILIGFSGKKVALIDGSFVRPSSMASSDMNVLIEGSAGSLSFVSGGHTMLARVGIEPHTEITVIPTQFGDWYNGIAIRRLLFDFINCSRECRKPISNGQVGLLVNNVLDAIYRSLRENKVVYLTDLH
jgi:predicted dehydrogenase